MGLKSTIASAIQSGFNALGASSADGLQVSLTYTQITSQGAYNPSTGVKAAPTTSDTTFDAIKYDVEMREVDGQKIRVGDQKLIFPANRITFDPSMDDYVTISSIKWDIKDFYTDPAGATWTLLVRRN